jgi:hypothetical protein
LQPVNPHDLNVRRFAALEKIIESSLKNYIQVADALREIRDKRLYKPSGFGRFEDYCKTKWGCGRNYDNKQIAAATFAQSLGTGVPIPQTERQAG